MPGCTHCFGLFLYLQKKMMQLPMYGFKIENKIYRTISGGDTKWLQTTYRILNSIVVYIKIWIPSCDLAALPDGKTVIDGERVFVNVMEADLREAEGAEYEYHKRYADLQIDISGSEYWEWTDKAEFTDTFQEASDCGLAAGRSRCGGTLGDGSFALFLPEEFHKPSCKNGSHTHVRKAVIKIEM